MQVISQSGDTMDAICWRHLGRTAIVTEQALAMNAGVAAFGPIIPNGTIITLPESEQSSQPRREIIDLWS